jgi:membrane protein insertase Oxa1/YidC/SpoIIIJ
MMVAMPLMMVFFTFSVSGGVGVYWISGNIIAIIQQILIVRFFMKPKKEPAQTVE